MRASIALHHMLLLRREFHCCAAAKRRYYPVEGAHNVGDIPSRDCALPAIEATRVMRGI
jgi:hypothetical protein